MLDGLSEIVNSASAVDLPVGTRTVAIEPGDDTTDVIEVATGKSRQDDSIH